jgi:geranylgeranyl pyrophosphate synthase
VRLVSSVDTLSIFLASARERVDEALERYLPVPPACPGILSEAMRYSVFAGGKRLRPILVLAAADATERAGAARMSAPAGELALPAACALELIHTYSLIHDDLPAMDDDRLRRGRPTLHIVYGEGIAILAADGLQAEAFSLLAREPSGPSADDPELARRKLRVIRVIADAAGPIGMVGGQAVDLQAAGQAPGGRVALDANGLRAMHARKTGALIRAAAVSGAVLAGGDVALVGAMDSFSTDVGLAFQIVDDILDVEGEASRLGKTAGKDAADAKPTYPALFGLERSRTLAAECIARARQTLADAQLAKGWLIAIAEWVVSRTN